ncbi:GNAT family N-acetyltransferase [Ornithinibacillus sp. L9]|uniref:GNAT family N-acetyltransferase n=1 Tax=Ornithinibacillus caprae TaxID=2678566 RepID=A0A6N8FJL7_9BACI|nr:GNAT family N-acetyltransferase [Ornithinibacillus caprae]MUK88886.1 GNAT family N-acetyltransferase [Ornithinibacillus caprae]
MNISRTYDYELIAKLNKPVHELHVNLYPEFFKEYNSELITEAFKTIMQNKQQLFFVIIKNKEALGYIWTEVVQYQENVFRNSYQTLFVHQLCVSQTDRNKGYGTKLMEKVYQIAKEKKIHRIELDYWAGNDIMKSFCDKHGFQKHRQFMYKQL